MKVGVREVGEDGGVDLGAADVHKLVVPRPPHPHLHPDWPPTTT